MAIAVKSSLLLWYYMCMEKRKPKTYTRVAISDKAYKRLREMTEQPEFHGRGGVGVLDKLLLGEFTTEGSGRQYGSKNRSN